MGSGTTTAISGRESLDSWPDLTTFDTFLTPFSPLSCGGSTQSASAGAPSSLPAGGGSNTDTGCREVIP